MKILLSSLLLIGSLNLIVARHLYGSSLLPPYMAFNDYDYGLFNNQYNDEEYKKFMDIFLGENSNESIEKLPEKEMKPANDDESEIEVTKSSEEKNDNVGNNDDDDLMTEKDIEDFTNFLLTLPSIDDLNKIEEKTYDTKVDTNKYRDIDDNLNEKELKKAKEFLNVFSTILTMVLEDELESTKSSEENTNDNKDDDDNNKDNDDDKSDNEDNDKSDDKDDDDLNMVVEDELKTKKSSEEISNETNGDTENKHDNDDDQDNDDKTDDENNNNDSGDDNYVINTDNIDENEFSTVFLHHDNDSEETRKNAINDDNKNINRNYHIYDIVEAASQEFHSTSSPYSDETTSPPVSDYDGVQEYVEIRQKLDNLNDLLHENELNLDKDFYTVISQDHNGDGMKKFEYDLNVVYENLNRIKRHFDSVQNVKSKLYFHNLVKSAVEKAHNKSKEERF